MRKKFPFTRLGGVHNLFGLEVAPLASTSAALWPKLCYKIANKWPGLSLGQEAYAP